MSRIFLHTLFTAIAAVLTLVPMNAQQTVGAWTRHPLYSGNPARIVATPERAYFTTGGGLYSIANDGSDFMDHNSEMHSSSVNIIDYNAEKGFLAVGYTDGNIDLFYNNGTVVNLSDIRDALYNTPKTIHAIDHRGDELLVGTEFGFVVFDTAKRTVKHSGNWGRKVSAVGSIGDYYMVSIAGATYFVKDTDAVGRFESYKAGPGYNAIEMKRLGNDRIAMRTASFVVSTKINFETGAVSDQKQTTVSNIPWFSTGKDGVIYFVASNKLHSYSPDGTVNANVATIPADIRSHSYATWKGNSEIWAGNGDGVGRYDISTSTLGVLNGKILPPGATSVQRVMMITPSKDLKTIYFSNAGEWQGHPASATGAQQLDRLRDGKMENMALKGANITTPVFVAEDPDDPSIYYVASRAAGLYIMRDRERIGLVDKNSGTGLANSWGSPCFSAFDFDDNGNMWAVVLDLSHNTPVFLAAVDRIGKQADLGKGTFHKKAVSGFGGRPRGHIVLCRDGRHIVMGSSFNDDAIIVIDNNNTPDNPNDDRVARMSNWVDQDGKSFYYGWNMGTIREDRDGRIWFGGRTATFYLENPADVFDPNYHVVRPKVPRNDGTNFADYLLDGEQILEISVDGGNRKWFATANSGLYLVSADGSEILEHFTTDNSPLPTNEIASVYADPLSNRVYVGTANGLYSYTSSYSPASEDLSEVYAYPNPVRPDYTGWITVTNLMDGSLVKITDASGQVVHEARTEGGSIVWDGCNSNGRRVKSGVYWVMVSNPGTNGMGGDNRATKILILN